MIAAANAVRISTPVRIFIYLTMCGCLYLPAGCIHMPAPHLPSTWIGTPAGMEAIDDKSGQARIQIIIAYGTIVDNHAALRLVCPGRQDIFWDPGGGYNVETAPQTRWNDLIIEDPPDLKTYLEFRKNTHYDDAVEVFEWDITTSQARALYDVLWNGTGADHPAGRFGSDTPGLFCSTAISDFLGRFATDIMTVNDTYFWPNELARELYTQSPDRVMIFRAGRPPMVYIRPRKASHARSSPPSEDSASPKPE